MSIYKADIEAAKGQWEAFWAGRNRRPMLLSVLPRQGCQEIEKPAYASGHEGDFGPVLDQLAGWAESHEFLGEAIPFYYVEFAADHFSALLGADLSFPGKGGGWPVHFVKEWETTTLRFERDGKWWRRTVEMIEAIRKRFGDNVMIASPTLVANLDALVAVRGANELMLDLMDEPEAVKRALEQVLEAHGEILEALAKLLDYQRLGSINRHGVYSRGRINVPQCDFSCMLSGEMFREFVLPSLRQEMERLDAVEYHLDGPDATRHIEDLCRLEKLGIVQWVAGAGNEKKDWGWLFDKIDALGKGQLRWSMAKDAVNLVRKYRSRKLVLQLKVDSRQEFDDCAGQLEEAWRVFPAPKTNP